MKQQAQARAPRVAPAAILPAAQTRHIPIKKILSVAVLAVIIVLAGLLAYHHDQRQQAAERAFAADKARFSQLEADMTALSQSIKRETGFESAMTKSCGHTNLKFQTGDLYCLVSISLPVDSDETSNRTVSLIRDSKYFNVNEQSAETWKPGQTLLVSYRPEFSCEVNGDDKKDAALHLQCISPADKPLYALAE